ncbi:hypothetical protein SCUCBS95973_008758 [Sporothrix curviconia]|uniref:Zn(2)-C6 fungal-type domain-containing protein n=1 Tax=Sporothrix curviconia TaxID=1260050 RepID=A0ABP0CPK7_9PEZI
MSSPAKGPRQATACDWCRAHKLKCDAEQPSCRNCARRSVPCVTVDLRRPHAQGRRQAPVGRRRRSPVSTSTSVSSQSSASPTQTRTPRSAHPPLPPVPEYPPSPEQPLGRSFEPVAPERELPGLFAGPFEHDSVPDSAILAGGGSCPQRQALRQRRPASSTAASSTTTSRPAGHNSHHVLTQWMDLFFVQNAAWEPVYPHFRQGLAYAAEVPLPPLVLGGPSPALPELPPREAMNAYTALFFSRIHPLFPVLDQTVFQSFLADMQSNSSNSISNNSSSNSSSSNSSSSSNKTALSPSMYPQLATVFVVCSLAADEQAGSVTALGTRYLEAVYVLYAHLVALPCVASVQALLLLTLILRNRNKDAAAWGTLGQAVHLAQTIGLHRRSNGLDSGDLHARIWWTAYVFERSRELETGRATTIRGDANVDDDDSDDERCQVLPSPIHGHGLSFDYFAALVGLAKIKMQVVRLLYGGTQRPVRDLLLEMGRLDRALLDWADTFPESVRPGRDLICGGDELPLATYVALQFHQTLMALHRPALLSAPGFLRNRINEYCAGTPAMRNMRNRLHFSLCIGAASARSVLKATNDLSMYAVPVPNQIARYVTADQILMAVLVLGIYVSKVPMSRLNRGDLALVDTFGELAEEEYRRAGQCEDFLQGITLVRRQLCDYIAGVQRRPATTTSTSTTTVAATTAATTATTAAENALTASTVSSTPTTTISCLPSEPTSTTPISYGFDLTADGDVMNLEASWAHFWNEDFDKMLALPDGLGGDADMTNMYLLGIPQSWP